MTESPQPLPSEAVANIVRDAHGDLDRVRAALDREPTLVNAAWDWGGGDWETALGAAAHMGRRDIAELLLERGARLDVFAAAMLGQVEIVRAIVGAVPGTRDASGPHGIPLVEHARKGGPPARAVVDLLAGGEATEPPNELEFEIEAPREALWRALVDPGALCGWFATEARVTPEVGGEYFVAHGDYDQTSIVEEIVDGERLRTSHAGTSTEFVLESRGRATVLRIVQSGFDEGQQESLESGWASYVQTLRHYLARHAGDPAAAAYVYANAEGRVADVRRELHGTLPTGATVVDEGDRTLGAVIPRLGDGVYRASIEGDDGRIWLWVHLVAYGDGIAELDAVTAEVSARLAQLQPRPA